MLLVYALSIGSVMIRAPSVFRSDEVEMHKYSAILAATEPFRIQCEEQIKKSVNPIGLAVRRMLGKELAA
jgi:hypothetical protein